MPSLTLKNLPDVLYRRLREEAVRHRRSLNSEIIVCLEQVLLTRPLDPDTFLADLAALQSRLALSTRLDQDLLDRARGEGRP